MKKITKWYRLSKNENGEITSSTFNHWEDGWIANRAYPKPFSDKFTNQVAWKKDSWEKVFCYIDKNNKIIGDR